MYVDGRPFLASPHSIALALNVDWFQPYTHTKDSVGAVYAAVLNLPRDIRHKPENITSNKNIIIALNHGLHDIVIV